jgi:peptidoglycan/xylan/chitin deacetylase (PgdA/CDA1 family)
MKNFIHFLTITGIIAVLCSCLTAITSQGKPHRKEVRISGAITDKEGAIIRKDTVMKVIYLVSSADEFGDGADKMLDILSEKNVKASFFLTGNFLRNPLFKPVVQRMKQEEHYIGPHSDRHLLYNSWENRDSLLVTREQFRNDLKNNFAELKKSGIKRKEVTVFLAPYEWYNLQITAWSHEMKLQLINFTPGTGTNADYTTPDMTNYKSSDELFQRLFNFEKNNRLGLKGAILLIHLGTHPDRKDKFYDRLGIIIDELRSRGYQFRRM